MLTGEMGSLQYKSGEPIVDLWNRAADLRERYCRVYGRMDNQEWLEADHVGLQAPSLLAAYHEPCRGSCCLSISEASLLAALLEEEARREALKGGRNKEITEAHLGKGVGSRGKGGRAGFQDPGEEEAGAGWGVGPAGVGPCWPLPWVP